MTLLDSNITVGGFLAHSSLQHCVGRVQVDFGSQEKEASEGRNRDQILEVEEGAKHKNWSWVVGKSCQISGKKVLKVKDVGDDQ